MSPSPMMPPSIRLACEGGEVITVASHCALRSETISSMLHMCELDEALPLPLPLVDAKTAMLALAPERPLSHQ